jgi:hypothetical protein
MPGRKSRPAEKWCSIISLSLKKYAKYKEARRRSVFPGSPSSEEEGDVPAKHTVHIRGSRFLIYNFLQVAFDGKNNYKTKVEKVFFFIFMSSYAEMCFYK